MTEETNDVEKKQTTVIRSELLKKIGSALFYGVTSFLLTVVNKNILSVWKFPSFLIVSVGQMTATVSILYIARAFGIVTFPKFSRDIPKKVFPLPFFHFGNMATGLGGTQSTHFCVYYFYYTCLFNRYTSPTVANVHGDSTVFNFNHHDIRIHNSTYQTICGGPTECLVYDWWCNFSS